MADLKETLQKTPMKRKVIIAAMLALAVVLGWFARGFLASDACLDAGADGSIAEGIA